MQALDEIDDLLLAPHVNDLSEIDNLLMDNNARRRRDNYDVIAERLGLENWEPGQGGNMGGRGRGNGRGRGGRGARGRGRGSGRGVSNGRGAGAGAGTGAGRRNIQEMINTNNQREESLNLLRNINLADEDEVARILE